MEGYRDRQFSLEPQQTFHRQYEALRAVFVEGQPLELVAVRFGYKASALQSMVSHFRGTELIVAHIEKFVCPTVTSDQIIGGKPFRFKADPN